MDGLLEKNQRASEKPQKFTAYCGYCGQGYKKSKDHQYLGVCSKECSEKSRQFIRDLFKD